MIPNTFTYIEVTFEKICDKYRARGSESTTVSEEHIAYIFRVKDI
jgi:hypothetical protein